MTVKFSPINEKDAMTIEEQHAEGVEENDTIKYYQEFQLFNTSDYIGKTKTINVNYNKNMKVEIFKGSKSDESEDLELLESYRLTDLEDTLKYEIDALKRD